MRSIPAPVQRWLVLLLPPISILICCFVMVPRQKKLQQINRDIKQAQISITAYLLQLKAIKDLPPDPTIASMPMTRQEQSDFLRGLTLLCNRTGNRILSVQALAAVPAPAAPPAGANPPPGSALPADVLPIKSTIMFEGNFNSLRTFLGGLQRSRRLISMTECRVGAGAGGFPSLQTTLTVTRYIDCPVPAPTPVPAAPKT